MDRQRSDEINEWDTTAYDGSHSFVYEYGEDVIDLLDPKPDERILDLGCGTGHLTHTIAKTGATVVGIDSSTEMIEQARDRYPEIRFEQMDARSLTTDDPFDAVFSNAVLHWISDQDAVLEAVASVLAPGGRFVAEFGGNGNVSAIIDAVTTAAAERGYTVTSPWYFPSIGEHASRVETHGYETRYARLFDRPTKLDDGEDGLRAWIDMFGDELLASIPAPERDDVVSAAENRLRETQFDDGVWIADYRRIRIVAVRK